MRKKLLIVWIILCMAAVSLQPAFAAEVLTDDTVDETVPAEESGQEDSSDSSAPG